MSIHDHYFRFELDQMGLVTQKPSGDWQVDFTLLFEYVGELREGEKRIGQAMRLLLPPTKETAQKKFDKAADTFIDTIRDDKRRNDEFERLGYRFLFLWSAAAWDLWEYRSTEHTDSCKFMLPDFMIYLLDRFDTKLEKKAACTCH